MKNKQGSPLKDKYDCSNVSFGSQAVCPSGNHLPANALLARVYEHSRDYILVKYLPFARIFGRILIRGIPSAIPHESPNP